MADEPPSDCDEPFKVERVAPSDLESMRRLAELQLREVQMPEPDIEPPSDSRDERLAAAIERVLEEHAETLRRLGQGGPDKMEE
jgi:hypothetical protein